MSNALHTRALVVKVADTQSRAAHLLEEKGALHQGHNFGELSSLTKAAGYKLSWPVQWRWQRRPATEGCSSTTGAWCKSKIAAKLGCQRLQASALCPTIF